MERGEGSPLDPPHPSKANVITFNTSLSEWSRKSQLKILDKDALFFKLLELY